MDYIYLTHIKISYPKGVSRSFWRSAIFDFIEEKVYGTKYEFDNSNTILFVLDKPVTLHYGSGPTIEIRILKLLPDGKVRSIIHEDLYEYNTHPVIYGMTWRY